MRALQQEKHFCCISSKPKEVSTMTTVQYEKVSVQELHDRLDVLTREKLGLSADEFLSRCREQGLNMASPVVSRLAVIARLLEHSRQSRQPA